MRDAADLIPPAAELRANLKEASALEAQAQLHAVAEEMHRAIERGWPSVEMPTLHPAVIEVLRSKGYAVTCEQTGPNETAWVIRW